MSKNATPKDLGAARAGQMKPTDKGHTPDRTQMGKVAKIAAGQPAGGRGHIPSMPKGQIDKHN